MPREKSYSPRRGYRRTPEKRYDRRKRSRSPRGSRSPRRSRSFSPKYRGKKQFSPKHRSLGFSRGRGGGYNVPYGRKPSFEKRDRSPYRRDSGHRYSRSHSPSPKKRSRSRSPRRKSPEVSGRGLRPISLDEKRRDSFNVGLASLGHPETSTFPVSLEDPFSKPSSSLGVGGFKSYRDLSPDNSLSALPPGVIGTVTVAPPSSRRPLLSERFESIDSDFVGPIRIDENITIGIHRTGPNLRNTSNKPVVRNIDMYNFVMLRRRDEGKKPIFDREEIKIFGLDNILDEQIYDEKRTISVVPSDDHKKSIRSGSRYSPDRQDTRTVRSADRSREPKVRLNPKPDPRYEKIFQESEAYDSKSINPNDLRHNLMKRKHDDEDSFDARRKLEDRRKGSGRDHSDRDRKRSLDERLGKKSDSEELPDFKNRPGKYKFEAWKENPEMIPKNPMYFEHDNREGDSGSRGRFNNSRGFRGRFRRPFRGGYRGRGFRGRFRGRGYSNYRPTSNDYSSEREGDDDYDKKYDSYYKSDKRSRDYSAEGDDNYNKKYGFHYKSDKRSRDLDTWKHDLYDAIEKEEKEDIKTEDKSHDDNKPTSTTTT
ncbi:serine/arginine repetitive matrix protein 1-like [Saccostrea echinata]|uniref:serine/arginine repetitive matrix protein 1-like n=1 Tax=Saccostrea echinata TaxID=191078 RepID=UPI002A83934A|nr:serine/arginine repetitive matrix protein 1-like [Saccostrea echinata]